MPLSGRSGSPRHCGVGGLLPQPGGFDGVVSPAQRLIVNCFLTDCRAVSYSESRPRSTWSGASGQLASRLRGARGAPEVEFNSMLAPAAAARWIDRSAGV